MSFFGFDPTTPDSSRASGSHAIRGHGRARSAEEPGTRAVHCTRPATRSRREGRRDRAPRLADYLAASFQGRPSDDPHQRCPVPFGISSDDDDAARSRSSGRLSTLWASLVGWAIARLFTRDLEQFEDGVCGSACVMMLRTLILRRRVGRARNLGPACSSASVARARRVAPAPGLGQAPRRPSRSRIAPCLASLLAAAGVTHLCGAVRLARSAALGDGLPGGLGLEGEDHLPVGRHSGALFHDPRPYGATRSIPFFFRSLGVAGGLDRDSLTIGRSACSTRRSNSRRRWRFSGSSRAEPALAAPVAGLLTADSFPSTNPATPERGTSPALSASCCSGTAYLDVLAADRPAARDCLLWRALLCGDEAGGKALRRRARCSGSFLRSGRRRARLPLAAHSPAGSSGAAALLSRGLGQTCIVGTWISLCCATGTRGGRVSSRLLSYIAQTELVAAAVPLVALSCLVWSDSPGPADRPSRS